jgi:hypothetical protein
MSLSHLLLRSAALRFGLLAALLTMLSLAAPFGFGQTELATVFGRVTDQSGAVVTGAEVEIRNVETNTATVATTNGDGLYSSPSLHPGHYVISVRKVGFRTVSATGLELNIQDNVVRNFALQVGSASESITVSADASKIDTTDAAVGTVINRKFVENMPLNGRSFQTLISLTPGVVLTPTTSGEQGQFSVNGQRPDANYFTVDGVSANVGSGSPGVLGQAGAGAVPGFSASGTTSSLVSVDAMQEFKVQTSSFAPEFGRTPGGQIAILTRSGTNDLHGSIFEYFRNDVLDANNWFADRDGLRKPAERQNEFGGVMGGPIIENKTFFFVSYEGLRLRLPKTQELLVPDTVARQIAPSQIQPFLNAFPVANGAEAGDNLAQFNAAYSDPSSLDAYSIRLDHNVNSRFGLFVRYAYSPSSIDQRGAESDLNTVDHIQVRTHTLTLGAAQSLTPSLNNEIRSNYSNSTSGSTFRADTFGGAIPPSDDLLFPAGYSRDNSFFFYDIIGAGIFDVGKNAINEQRQLNIVDNLSFSHGRHQFKTGVDYRWLAPFVSPLAYEQGVGFLGMNGPNGALSGNALFGEILADSSVALLSRNFSLYGQDTWRPTPRLSITYGFRWDVNPALKGKNSASDPFTVENLNQPANLSLAPRGVPLYSTRYHNVAPRVGIAYQLNDSQNWLTVLRGGVGSFYDMGGGSLGSLTSGFPFTASTFLFGVPFPFTPQQAAPPPFSTSAPVPLMVVSERDLGLPRTYQWNAAIEQSLGGDQTFSVTYVGTLGRDLLRQDALVNPNLDFGTVFVTRNTATSDYHALQLKFQRRLSRGLQTLFSYTWSHAIDIASNDSGEFNAPASVASPALDRGDSDFDVRHSVTGAISYDLPHTSAHRVLEALTAGWSLDGFITARTATPINVVGLPVVIGNSEFEQRPDMVPGEGFYLHGSQYPGHVALNSAAFAIAPGDRQGDLGRNALRGFGAWQADFAARRDFPIRDRWRLQIRAEFFNIFNHPNFGNPISSLASQHFGVSTQVLSSALGAPAGGLSTGLSQLYQIGGPRSIQLALKIQF